MTIKPGGEYPLQWRSSIRIYIAEQRTRSKATLE
jgi:hypothetical protein